MRRLATVVTAAVLGGLAVAAPAAPAAARTACTVHSNLIGAVDQNHGRVLILRQDVDWRRTNPICWQRTLGGGRWGHLTDVKFRRYGSQWDVLVSAGNGNVGIFAYPSGRRIWSATVPNPRQGTRNPHSIELLPNGGVAVADSTGVACGGCGEGRLLYYPKGSRSPKVYRQPSAHGVLYSDGRLWAVGGSTLYQYDIGRGGLTRHGGNLNVGRGRVTGAHDLSPMTGSARHRMWIAGNAVYHYDKYSGRPPTRWIVPASRSCVKAFGTQRDGRIVEAWKNHCTGSNYLSDTVYLFRYDGTHPTALRLPGAGFYKARPVTWSYY